MSTWTLYALARQPICADGKVRDIL